MRPLTAVGAEFRRGYFVRCVSSERSDVVAKLRARTPVYRSSTDPDLLIARPTASEADRLRDEGAELIPARHHRPAVDVDTLYQPVESHPHSLDDVIAHVKADRA